MKQHAYLSPHTLDYRLQTGQFPTKTAFKIYEVESPDQKPKYVIGLEYQQNVKDVKDMGVIKKPIQPFTYAQARLLGETTEQIMDFLKDITSEKELRDYLDVYKLK